LHDSVIKVLGVVKHYGGIHAVTGVDLEVRAGEIFGLIGHNGAGKSTLIKIMLGLVRPDAGTVHIMGKEVNGDSFREVRRCIGYLPENIIFYDNLSGRETMHFFADLKGADPASCVSLLEKIGLGDAQWRPVREYSKGMRQRLGFAQALLGNPQVLFLDEPTTGLDPGGVAAFYEILAELKHQGVTVILSSHNLAQIQDRLDRLALMRLGCLQAAGTVQALRETLILPVHIRLHYTPAGADNIRAALSGIHDCTLKLDGSEGTVACSRSQKMEILAALTSVSAVVDVQIHEPSLEDVYLGYAENAFPENNHEQN